MIKPPHCVLMCWLNIYRFHISGLKLCLVAKCKLENFKPAIDDVLMILSDREHAIAKGIVLLGEKWAKLIPS